MVLGHLGPTPAGRWCEFSVAPVPMRLVALASCLLPPGSVAGEQKASLLGLAEVRTSPSLFTHHTHKFISSLKKFNLTYFCQNPFQESKSKLKVL